VSQISDTRSPIKCLLSIILALGLLSSFGLHAVQIEHEHFLASPAHGAHEHKQGFATLDTYMHLSDKKYLIFLPVVLLALSFLGRQMRIEELLLLSATRSARMIHERYGNQYRMFDYIRLFLKKGILHSKTY
jgi:hypothetical protein